MKRRDECLMDSGAVTFYRVSSDEAASNAGRWTLEELITIPFQMRTVGYTHAYTAKAAKQDIDAAIRIWDFSPNLSLSTADTLALVQGRYYRVLKFTKTKDPDGLPVLDIDLTDDDSAIRRKIA